MNPVCTILLAAGRSQRFGSAKLLATLDGVTLVRRAAEAALASATSLYVVTGAYAEEIRRALTGLDVAFIDNPDWNEGMGSSIGMAFRHLLADASGSIEAAIILPADLPRVGSAQLQQLLDAHRSAPNAVIAANHGTVTGPPCLFPRRCFAALSKLTGTTGARPLLVQEAQALRTVAMPEAAVDVDTPDDLAAIDQDHP